MTSNDLQYEMDFHNKMKNSPCPQGIKFRYNMCKQGRIQPVSLGGGDFRNIWQSVLSTGSLLQKT